MTRYGVTQGLATVGAWVLIDAVRRSPMPRRERQPATALDGTRRYAQPGPDDLAPVLIDEDSRLHVLL